jgi:outer membrane lipoprotein-sorting protein
MSGRFSSKVAETYRAATEYEVVVEATGREDGKENRYRSIPGDQLTPTPGNLGEGPEFLMSGIRSIARQAGNGKLVREENLAIGGSDTACYVIEVTLERQPETLWVDKKRYVILRTETADAKVTFTTVKLNQPPPDELFKFDPPPGATTVERPR